MITREQIVLAARRHVNTKYHHQGRLAGVGLDCIGLLVAVHRDLGIPHVDFTGYSKWPDGETLQREIEKSMTPIASNEVGLGDVYLFRLFKRPCHVGIRSDIGVIHTYSTVGKVVEHGMDDNWLRRVVGGYRFHSLQD